MIETKNLLRHVTVILTVFAAVFFNGGCGVL